MTVLSTMNDFYEHMYGHWQELKEYISQQDTTTILVFSGVLLASYLALRTLTSDKRAPPGPYRFPVLGNLPQLAMAKSPLMYEMFDHFRRKYGDVMQLHFGPLSVVVISGYKVIKEAFIEKGHIFADRPQLFFTDKVFRGHGVIFANGKPWKDMRKFTVVTLRDFGVGKKSLEERILDEARIVLDVFENNASTPFTPKRMFTNAVSNIICGIVFGNRFDYNDKTFQGLLDCLDYLAKHAGIQLPENFVPLIYYIPPLSRVRKLVANDEHIRQFVREQIKEHRDTYDGNNIRDFIDLYVQVEKEGSMKESMTEENMFRTIMDLFAAGSETTATTLAWLCLYMMKYPNIQRKCHEEIDRVVGSSRQVALADRSEMVYVMSTIQELQRHANISPAAIPRSTTEAVEVGGYVIPAKMMVIADMRSVHLDPNLWPNPMEFKPERWIDDNGHIRKTDAFMPFSLGLRTCLGEPLARMEIFLFFSNLLQRFSLEAPAEGLPDMDGFQEGIVHHCHPFKVVLSKRE